MSETKLCKDCKHYGKGNGDAKTDKCFVKGSGLVKLFYTPCIDMRRYGECGGDGYLFKSSAGELRKLHEKQQAEAQLLALIRGGTDGQD